MTAFAFYVNWGRGVAQPLEYSEKVLCMELVVWSVTLGDGTTKLENCRPASCMLFTALLLTISLNLLLCVLVTHLSSSSSLLSLFLLLLAIALRYSATIFNEINSHLFSNCDN
jgi:hypothetical protein